MIWNECYSQYLISNAYFLHTNMTPDIILESQFFFFYNQCVSFRCITERFRCLCVCVCVHAFCCCRSVTKSCTTLWPHGLYSTPGLPAPHHLLEFAQVRVHWTGDAIQPSHPLLPSSPPAFNLSQHQGLFQWIACSHQVAKVLELQLQYQSFQWAFRVCVCMCIYAFLDSLPL